MQYSPVRAIISANVGLNRAKKDASRRRERQEFFSSAIEAAQADTAFVLSAVDQLQKADGMPVRMNDLNLDDDCRSCSAFSMGSLLPRSDDTASRGTLEAWREERRRGYKGFSQRDELIRHRQLVRTRAAAAACVARGGAVDGDGEGDAEPGAASLAAFLVRNQQEEARLHRLVTAPPLRFWLLLLLWAIGGVFGAHRIGVRSWRVASLQFGATVLGLTLVIAGTALLDPVRVPARGYPYLESNYVRALGSIFAVVALLLWLRDGILLLPMVAWLRYHPTEKEVAAAAAAAATAGAAGAAARPRRQRHNVSGSGSGGDGRGASAEAAMAAREAASPIASFDEISLRFWWLILGLPCCAHRWALRHYVHASVHCALLGMACLLWIEAAGGTLASAYRLCMTLGIVLVGGSLTLWFRDGAQLLRGRLGVQHAPAVEFWIFLGSWGLLGTVGMHRLLLRRYRSAALYPSLAFVGFGLAADAALGLTESLFGLTFMRLIVGILAAGFLFTLLARLAIDLRAIMHSTLRPTNESPLYWNILFSWLFGGLLFGMHRIVANKVSWKAFVILNVYGAGLYCLTWLFMRVNEGDASQGDTSKFAAGDSLAVDIVGGGCLLISLVWWLADLRLVARNRLQHVEETSLWWNAFVVWGSPVGLLGGFHFTSFERPYDWQLFCSLSTIGILTGLTSRQYAAVGRRDEANLLTLIAGLLCFGINLARFIADYADMRPNSILKLQIGSQKFRLVRRAYFTTGLICSGHLWLLRKRRNSGIACFTTILLHSVGTWLLVIVYTPVTTNYEPPSQPLAPPPFTFTRPPPWPPPPPSPPPLSPINRTLPLFPPPPPPPPPLFEPLPSNDMLKTISISFLLLLALLWIKDGLLLITGRADLSGEQIEIVEDDGDVELQAASTSADGKPADEDEPVLTPIEPLPHWRTFRTNLNSKYYFDPKTEFVHHLSRDGQGNYAVDHIHNRTFVYDSLQELNEKVELAEFDRAVAAEEAARIRGSDEWSRRIALGMDEQRV